MELLLARDLAGVFVLNLRRREDRLHEFHKTAERAGLTGPLAPVRIEAVDGRHFPVLQRGAAPAESATGMGHRYIWGLALAAGKPVLVFEDDAVLCNAFSNHLTRPLSVPEDTDILQLGMSWLHLHPGAGQIRQVKSGYGLFACVLFPGGALKLLRREAARPLLVPDHYSRPSPDFKVMITYPTWATLRNQESDIKRRAPAAQRMGCHFEDDQPHQNAAHQGSERTGSAPE